MEKTICFYHNADLDGKCSAAIVKKFTPKAELYGINHGDRFPYEILSPEDVVYMVDFSLQPFEKMILLKERCPNLIWIDHHASAIRDAEINGFEAPGIQRVGIGACFWAWEYFHSGISPIPIPQSVRLLAECDVWNHSDPATLPFQYGMRFEEDTSPENQDFWKLIFLDRDIEKIIENGQILLKYERQQNKKYARTWAFETKLDGFRACALNKGHSNSLLFESVFDPQKHDIMLSFCRRRDKQWTVHLYTTKENVNCGQIAARYGGGGHLHAAGFQCQQLPFFY